MFVGLPGYPDTRRSPVPWAPVLPAGWRVERGKALFTRVDRPTRADDGVVTCFRDGVVTLRSRRRTTGFTESLKEIGYQGVRKGDLVIHEMDAFAGAAGVSDSDGKSTPVYSVCVPRSNANPHYFAAVVRQMARTSWILALSKGIRERSTDFRFEMFGTQLLPVPPADEQAAIVKYLAHANTRIDKAVAAKVRLVALFDEYFTVAVDDLLGPDASHVEVVSIGQTSQLVQTGPFGSQLHAEEYVDGGTPVLNPSHLTGRGIAADRTVAISAAKAEDLARHRLLVGDVIAARRGDLGRCDVVTEREAGWVCGTGSLIVRLRRDRWVPEYFQLLFSSRRNKERLEIGSVGSTMSNLNAAQVGRLRMARPSLESQLAVVAEVRHLRATHEQQLTTVTREIELLREFRRRLVADVVTGQVDVRHVAASLSDVDENTTWADSGSADALEPADFDDLVEASEE
jgi:type I restriction enzyme S subunit